MKRYGRSVSTDRWQVILRPWPYSVSFARGVDDDGWAYIHLEWGRQWYVGMPRAHTLRSGGPVSKLPIFRWRLNLGPVAIHRWNHEQDEHPDHVETA